MLILWHNYFNFPILPFSLIKILININCNVSHFFILWNILFFDPSCVHDGLRAPPLNKLLAKKFLIGAQMANLAVHACLQVSMVVYFDAWYTLSILYLDAVNFFHAKV